MAKEAALTAAAAAAANALKSWLTNDVLAIIARLAIWFNPLAEEVA